MVLLFLFLLHPVAAQEPEWADFAVDWNSRPQSPVSLSGLRWNAARKSLEDWGRPPARIEVVRGTAVLKALAPATAVRAEPLDGAGHVLGPAHKLRQSDQGWELPLGTPPTTWYLITVTR
jgi:hypothetical protein